MNIIKKKIKEFNTRSDRFFEFISFNIAQTLPMLSSVFLLSVLSHSLTIEDMNLFMFSFVNVTVISILFDLGTNNLLYQYRLDNNSDLWTVHSILVVYRVSLFIVILLIVWFLYLLGFVSIELCYLTSGLWLGAIINSRFSGIRFGFDQIFRAGNQFNMISITSFIDFVMVVSTFFFLSQFNLEIQWIGFIWALCFVPGFLFQLIKLKPPLLFRSWKMPIKKIAVFCSSIALLQIFFILFPKIDFYIVSSFHSEMTAAYAIVQRIESMFGFVSISIVSYILPVLVRWKENNVGNSFQLFQDGITVLALVTFPIILLFSVFSGEIISVLFGQNYNSFANMFNQYLLIIPSLFYLFLINEWMIYNNLGKMLLIGYFAFALTYMIIFYAGVMYISVSFGILTKCILFIVFAYLCQIYIKNKVFEIPAAGGIQIIIPVVLFCLFIYSYFDSSGQLYFLILSMVTVILYRLYWKVLVRVYIQVTGK